jgi:hypothetical protein
MHESVSKTYRERITQPDNRYEERITEMLRRYPIEHPGIEFIVRTDVAIQIVDEFTALGVAVEGVTVWCYIPHFGRDKCCNDGYGGPMKEGGGWFSEYVHIGYALANPETDAPDHEKTGGSQEKIEQDNARVKQYITEDLPKEQGYSSRFRVSFLIAIPSWRFLWDAERRLQLRQRWDKRHNVFTKLKMLWIRAVSRFTKC